MFLSNPKTNRWTVAAVCLLLSSWPLAADAPPNILFTPTEGWFTLPGDVTNPAPFALISEAGGVAVNFVDSTQDSVCQLIGKQWRLRPLGLKPTQITFTCTSDSGVTISPVLVDSEGSVLRLPAKPANGTLNWDIHEGEPMESNSKNSVYSFHHADSTHLVGPVYLQEIDLNKAKGPSCVVHLNSGSVVDPTSNLLVFATQTLFTFSKEEPWVRNRHDDPSQYTITNGPDGMIVDFAPNAKLTHIILHPSEYHHVGGSLGHPLKIDTDVELVEGDANSTFVTLSLRDNEGESFRGDISPAPAQGFKLALGHNHVCIDAGTAASPWQGKNNGVVDYPVALENYFIAHTPTAQETKIIFHSATVQSWENGLIPGAVTTDRPRFLWKPGEEAKVQMGLKNLLSTPIESDFQLTLQDDLEHQLWTRKVHVSLPANQSGTADFHVDTTGLPFGVYILNWACLDINPNLTGRTLLTLADDAPIGKAKPGEFIYGMDIGGRWDAPNRLDWADWCGIDMIRGCGADERDPNDIKNALNEFSRRGLQGMLLLDPVMPWDADRTKFAKQVSTEAAYAGSMAAALKDTPLHWYEIGNEPSLTKFFPGPESDFVTEYLAMHDAIKAANPNAFVFLGGIAFQGMPHAGERAEELVKIFPADKTDAWAYHGHGDGAKAERRALGQMHHLLDLANKKAPMLLETESGTTSMDPVSWHEQARTVVQKLTFAQSTHEIPAFLWFCLQPGWVWGILETESQAKPAALAFRVLVQHTRGMTAQNALDLQGAKGEGYWFAPNAADDQRLTMVFWSDYGTYTRTVNLGGGATDVKFCDMFGNTKPAEMSSDGLVQVTAGLDPIYLVAKRPSGSPAPIILAPPITLPIVLRVVPGSDYNLDAIVHNPGTLPLNATVAITPSGNSPIAATQSTVDVPAQGQATTAITLHMAPQSVDKWPRAWTVFLPVSSTVDLSSFTSIPDTIPDGAKSVSPQTVFPVDNVMDFSVLSGPGYIERQQAICFAKIDSDSDTDLQIGAGADFWMEWYVNGQQVCSTMDKGNKNTPSVLSYSFPIHLKKGENLLAVRVLSGSGGWKLAAGSPQAVQLAQNALAGTPNGVVFDLRDGTRLLGSETVPVEILPALDQRPSQVPWDHLVPNGLLGHIDNEFMKAPDQTKWYHGNDDLSGRVWFRATADPGLVVAVAVRDDIDTPGDGVQIRLASGEGWKNRLQINPGDSSITRHRDDATKIAWYETTISADKLALQAAQPLAIEVTVFDDDWGVPKQTACLAGGDDPATWYQTWLR